MNKKQISKKYLISLLSLYFAGALITFLVLLALSRNGMSNISLTVWQAAKIALCCALVPVGSYCGFCLAGFKIKDTEKPGTFLIVCVCVFFPITLAIITIFGIIMIIPSIVYSVHILSRG